MNDNNLDVQWLVPARIILIKDTPILTYESTLKANEDIIQLMNTCESDAVHLIFIKTISQEFPTNLKWLRQHLTFVKHSKLGYIIIITENRILRYLGRVITRTMGSFTPHCASSYDEARQILTQLDPTLPPMPDSIGE